MRKIKEERRDKKRIIGGKIKGGELERKGRRGGGGG